jgi:hypothetical protein
MLIGPVLLLHGEAGGWDELIVLAAGIILAVVVVKWTGRSARDEDDEDDEVMSPSDGVSEKPTEQS